MREIIPFVADESPPFYFSVKQFAYGFPSPEGVPDLNWRKIYLPDYGDLEIDITSRSNKEQEDGLFLKQKPRGPHYKWNNSGYFEFFREGVQIFQSLENRREIEGPIHYGPKAEADWAFSVLVQECDVKHRPWEGVQIVVEIKTEIYDGYFGQDRLMSTSYRNHTLSLDSSNFGTTPVMPNYFSERPTGYREDIRAFYKTYEVLGTVTIRAAGWGEVIVEWPTKVISITPSSPYEPPVI